VRDPEAKNAAEQLGIALETSGWKISEWTNAEDNIVAGIFIEANHVAANSDDRSLEARDALVSWLVKSGFKAHALTGPRQKLRPGAVRISVGPSERFDNRKVLVKYDTILNKGPQDQRPGD
jgi:hypothetical protein